MRDDGYVVASFNVPCASGELVSGDLWVELSPRAFGGVDGIWLPSLKHGLLEQYLRRLRIARLESQTNHGSQSVIDGYFARKVVWTWDNWDAVLAQLELDPNLNKVGS